jgi:hypothetical protein
VCDSDGDAGRRELDTGLTAQVLVEQPGGQQFLDALQPDLPGGQDGTGTSNS